MTSAPHTHPRSVIHLAQDGAWDELARVLPAYSVPGSAGTRTLLHWAASWGRGDVAEVLLARGLVDVDVRDGRRRTPLHCAAANGQVRVLRLLLRAGADPDVQCVQQDGDEADESRRHGGDTPLLEAVRAAGRGKISQKTATRVVVELLEQGADRSVLGWSLQTAKDVAELAEEHVLDEVLEVLETYFPLRDQMVQVLLGVCGSDESALGRFAAHDTFDRNLLGIVAAFHSGKESGAFEALQERDGEA